MVGLFGGTFDPVHEGHLSLARAALAFSELEKIYLVPARQNPLKEIGPSAGPEDRLAMLRLAVAGEPRFEVLDWELTSPAPSYTVHTVERLTTRENQPVTLIMGNEVFATLPHWHEVTKLVTLCDFLVVMRTGAVGFTPETAKGARVTRMDMAVLPISATKMRERLVAFSRDSQSTPPGISRAVWGYIKEKGLYTVSTG